MALRTRDMLTIARDTAWHAALLSRWPAKRRFPKLESVLPKGAKKPRAPQSADQMLATANLWAEAVKGHG